MKLYQKLILVFIFVSIVVGFYETPQPQPNKDNLYEVNATYFVYAEDQPATDLLLKDIDPTCCTNNFNQATFEVLPTNEDMPYKLSIKLTTPNKKELNKLFNQTNDYILKQAKQLAYKNHLEHIEITLMKYAY